MLKYLIVGIVAIVCVVAEDFETPKWLGLCPRNENINSCLKRSIQDALPRLGRGSREFKIPPLDPYYLKTKTYSYKIDRSKITFTFNKLNVYGFSSSQVNDVRTEFTGKNFHMEIDMFSPGVFIDANYKAICLIDNLPVTGKGYFNNSMHDLTYTIKLWGKEQRNADGQNYIKIDQFEMRPVVGQMKLYLSDLKFLNVQIAPLVNTWINSLWRTIYPILLPFTEVYWNEYGIMEANKIFQKIPVQRLFAQA